MWLRILILVLTLGFIGPTSVAFAQDDAARAIELIAKGNTAYDQGDFRTALEHYRGAYTITGDPRVLYRIGTTYENLSNYQRAREHLELYILAEPDSQYSGRVKAKIEKLRDLEASLQSAVRVETQPPGASVWIDTETGRPSGVAPVRVPLGPGQHSVLIRKEGFEDVRDTIDLGKAETLRKTYDLGSGGIVADPVAAAPTTPEQSAAAPVAASPDVMVTGQPSIVRIGPSAGISFLSWFSIAAGSAVIVTSAIVAAGFGNSGGADGVATFGFFAGAGLVALGGYFLWFRDYTKDLPRATTALLGTPPAQRLVGMGIRF